MVYGGIGRAARDWACYDQILASLPDESAEGVPSELRFVVRGRALATNGSGEDES